MPDVETVASSATTPEAIPQAAVPVLAELNAEQRAHWRVTGEVAPVASTPSADSSPAAPVEQVASTEAVSTPASEPGSAGKKKNADTRKQELQADIDALLVKRAQLRAEVETPRPAARIDAPPAVSSPATSTDAFPDLDTWAKSLGLDPTTPDLWEEHIAARTIHRIAQQQAAAQRKADDESAAREAQDSRAKYLESVNTFIADHPDYWAQVNPITEQAPVTPTTQAIGEALTRSAVTHELLYHLGTHRDEFQRLVALGPIKAVYELGKLEASLSSPALPVVTTQRTTVPAPIDGLHTRAVAPVDDVDAALASGDFRRYKAAQNARDVAARR